MATLFSTITMKGMTLENRLLRSATWEGMCEPDGRPTQKVISLYRQLARGGVGLTITGYAYVRPEGKQLPGKMGIYSDAFSSDYKALTGAIHEEGGKVALQIVHAGGEADAKTAGQPSLAPSAVKVDQFSEIPVELSRDEIGDIVKAFADGARRAKDWGFDAVQLHCAHGFLINQFLSPLTNQRSDEYGGDIDNRCRFMLEVCKEVRKAVGDNFPVLVKLNAVDYVDGGFEIDDAVYAAKMLSEAGIDGIEVSSGTPASGENNPSRGNIIKPESEAYNQEFAQQIKAAVACPVIVVGGFRTLDVAEKAISEYGLDCIAMARPLIREPDLPNRWINGDERQAKCISCNKCFMAGIQEGGISCVFEK